MQSSGLSTICASCRLHHRIAVQQSLRSGKRESGARYIHVTPPLRLRQRHAKSRAPPSDIVPSVEVVSKEHGIPRGTSQSKRFVPAQTVEETVLRARKAFGDRLPDGLLNAEEGQVYERLYGRPLRPVDELDRVARGGRERRSRNPNAKLEIPLQEGWHEVDPRVSGSRSAKAARWRDRQHTEQLDQDMANAQIAKDINAATEHEHEEADGNEEDPQERTHPLTTANRFGTNPKTMYLPKDTLVNPINAFTKRTAADTMKDIAHRIFGGIGLPNSTSTPGLGKTLPQKPIPLSVSQRIMSEMDADVFTAILMPAVYASIMSVLVETRKRLGTAWAESMVRKAEQGTLQILDAGGAGMGVLAVREMLKAEWERMKEEEQNKGQPMSVALAGGKTGGVAASPPLGKATAWVSSSTLRDRASTLVQDTTFIPRMPDYVHTETARYSGKFDIIIAAHTIWPIREDWERRLHVENLWSLLRAESGVLCILEKGVARGFEAVAAARRFLLRTRIAEPDSQQTSAVADQEGEWESVETVKKEAGMIIAPCTNHNECPMYRGSLRGTIKGRPNICNFEQRYIRPAFLQRVLRARDKNHEDVEFSYLSVIRGTDFRSKHKQALQDTARAVQGDEATDRAAQGFSAWSQGDEAPSPLSLPRVYLPAIKRQGHVIIDVCTPSGELERWTVPRSFSKQAFRDARKSNWGDLWAMGAKTRIPRVAKLGKHSKVVAQPKIELSKKATKAKRRLQETKVYRSKRTLKTAEEEE